MIMDFLSPFLTLDWDSIPEPLEHDHMTATFGHHLPFHVSHFRTSSLQWLHRQSHRSRQRLRLSRRYFHPGSSSPGTTAFWVLGQPSSPQPAISQSLLARSLPRWTDVSSRARVHLQLDCQLLQQGALVISSFRGHKTPQSRSCRRLEVSDKARGNIQLLICGRYRPNVKVELRETLLI
jgi:hypothetical protein